MGKYFDLTLQIPQYQAGSARLKRREKQQSGVAESSTQLQAWQGLIMAFVTSFAILSYLILANFGATASYQITQMQSNMSSLIQQQQQLETQRAELQSMQSIQGSPVVTAMVPVSAVTYLSR